MSRTGEVLATLRADLRQRVQLLRARIERAREGPYRRRPLRAPVAPPAPWEASAAWAGDEGARPSADPSIPRDGLMSRPRTVHDATERLQANRSLIRRQRSRRAL